MKHYDYKGIRIFLITLLLIIVNIQSCIAVVQEEIIKAPTINPDDTRYLANFTMDFGENITNNRIDYEEIRRRPFGDWTVNVKINFRCPENLKIVVRYSYFARLRLIDQGHKIIFCDFEDTVTIIDGSNPPDIDIDFTEDVFDVEKSWHLILEISANLTAYKYLDGEWVFVHWDEIHNYTSDTIWFNRIRTSERTQVLMRFFERFPMLERLLSLLL